MWGINDICRAKKEIEGKRSDVVVLFCLALFGFKQGKLQHGSQPFEVLQVQWSSKSLSFSHKNLTFKHEVFMRTKDETSWYGLTLGECRCGVKAYLAKSTLESRDLSVVFMTFCCCFMSSLVR